MVRTAAVELAVSNKGRDDRALLVLLGEPAKRLLRRCWTRGLFCAWHARGLAASLQRTLGAVRDALRCRVSSHLANERVEKRVAQRDGRLNWHHKEQLAILDSFAEEEAATGATV